jgi:hypothetical protein
MTGDDFYDCTQLATEARAIRLAATRLEKAAKDWAASAAISNHELVKLRRELGTVRRGVDVLFETFGKADR